jgi:hypothetical protein
MLLLCYGLAMCSTYYIDFAAGIDANNGTSKTTSWKRHPYMAGWTGSYSHSAGDHFIFKGGVTWPNACFRMNITNGGTSDAIRDYYGVDSAWYTGGAFSRPIFDMQGSQTATYNQVMNFAVNYITVDCIEIKNFYWSGDQGTWGNCTIMEYAGGQSYIDFKNLFIHAWTHGTYANGTSDGDMVVFRGQTSTPWNPGVVIEYCTITGAPSDTDGGIGVYGGSPIIRYCTFHDLSNGVITAGGPNPADHLFYNNLIYNINNSFDPTEHENSVYIMGPAKVYNNIIYNSSSHGMMLYLSPGWAGQQGDQYCYNNVVYGVNSPGNPGIVIDCESVNFSGTVYILNNTVYGLANGTGSCLQTVPRSYAVAFASVQNNHWITTSGTPFTVNNMPTSGVMRNLTQDHNLIMSPTIAIAQGYVSGNNYGPTGPSNGTINAGISKSNIITTDILGKTRSPAAWDIGAYEYLSNSNPPVITSQPSNLVKYVGQQAVFTVAAAGTGTLTYQWSKFSINIPGATNSSYTTPVLVLGDNGNVYTCLVKDNNGSTMSRSATLAVNQIGNPIISSLVPSSGNYIGGYKVHLISSNVLTSGGKPTLMVGSKSVTSFTSTENSADFTMPFGPVGKTNVILTNYQGGKDTAVFTRDSLFYFASVSPVSSTNGTVINYRGGGFKPNRGSGTISLDSVFIITLWSDTLIQVKLNLNRTLTVIKNSTGSKDTLAGSILGGTLTY